MASVLALLWLGPLLPAWADNKTAPAVEDTAFLVKEIVVSAQKVETEQRKITQKIDVYTEQEIQHRTLVNRNLAEIFLYSPGAFVNTLSRNDANWGSYGGLGPKYNTYLLDGLPIDSFVDPMSLDYLNLERAEIHRGPASIMYSNYMSMDFAGNQAPLAGISNLITKEKIAQPMTLISLGGGSWNTMEGRIYHQGAPGGPPLFPGRRLRAVGLQELWHQSLLAQYDQQSGL
jgi:outer membrane receptor protein involved in Fe transport